MKRNKFKILFVISLTLFLSGCTKSLVDDDKKVVRYDASIICNSCNDDCDKIKKEINNVCTVKDKKSECNKKKKELNKKLSICNKNCKLKCDNAKKNQTGQTLTSNILCKPTNPDVIEIYSKFDPNFNKIPECNDLNIFSNYDGLWSSLFVKPLAWLIIKAGDLFNNFGFALIVISLFIRLLMMPLTKKTISQSESIKKAQPELDRINKKYENKNDQQSQIQKSQEMVLVYQKYKINPLSSCLFAFIQIPLLFAFLEAINRTPAIFEGTFLGLHLGTTPLLALRNGEWWYIFIVIILALVTYFSFNLNNNMNNDENNTMKQMKTMNNIMIIFIVIGAFSLSTAISIYWITSSLFTIVQNIIMKRVK